MRAFLRLIDRIVPALLMASGVTLLAVGLLSYAEPVLGDPPTRPVATAGLVAERPDLLPSLSPAPSGSAEPIGSPEPGATLLPSGSPTPTLSPAPSPSSSTSPPSPASPSPMAPGVTPSATSPPPPPPPMPTAAPTALPATGGVATRVAIPSERIDLPIISRQERVPGQGPDLYPPCDVALFHDAFGQPGSDGSTYLYAHARAGMFLPLLEASEQQDGASLLGALVEVYTADDRLYVYEIFQVKRHAIDFSLALDVPPGEQRLVLQTSEGPRGTVPKLQVAARLISQLPATREESRPRARPVACYG